MHNNNNKHNVRCWPVVWCQYCLAVWCVELLIKHFSQRMILSLSLKSAVEVVTENDDTIKATQTESTNLTYNRIPDDISGQASSSAGYRLVVKAVSAELRKSRPTYALKLLQNDPTRKKT
jgi:hypothetical protein